MKDHVDQLTQDKSMQTAKDRLKIVIPHLIHAIQLAEKEADGQGQIAIIANNKDGTGRVTASFEASEFIEDLKEITGITPEELAKGMRLAEATSFLHKLGIENSMN